MCQDVSPDGNRDWDQTATGWLIRRVNSVRGNGNALALSNVSVARFCIEYLRKDEAKTWRPFCSALLKH